VETTELSRWVIAKPESGADLFAELRTLTKTLGSGAEVFVEAFGEISDPIIHVLSDSGERTERRMNGSWDIATSHGRVDPSGACVLHALLVTDGATGPQQLSGLLTSARAAQVTVRAAVEKVVVVRASSPSPSAPERPSTPSPTPAPVAATNQPSSNPGSPPLPKRPQRQMGLEAYPEEGDIVNHFHFGRCVVVSSDGERLRLQQEKDNRVREVAISMLKVDEPTILEDGKKHWELLRKN
jgi:hypothetical protein